jgi:hypothetical protein
MGWNYLKQEEPEDNEQLREVDGLVMRSLEQKMRTPNSHRAYKSLIEECGEVVHGVPCMHQPGIPGAPPDIESCFAGRSFEIAERRGSPPCAFCSLLCSETAASSPMPLP